MTRVQLKVVRFEAIKKLAPHAENLSAENSEKRRTKKIIGVRTFLQNELK